MGLPPITRPNGKLYRPRHIRTQMLGNEDETTGIVVFGTLNRNEARTVAELDITAMMRDWFGGDGSREDAARNGGHDYRLEGEPEPVWWRRSFTGFYDGMPQYWYAVDEERGAFGYEWRITAHDVEEASDGVMPPPLDGLDVLEEQS